VLQQTLGIIDSNDVKKKEEMSNLFVKKTQHFPSIERGSE
jgi:hypothetical protein